MKLEKQQTIYQLEYQLDDQIGWQLWCPLRDQLEYQLDDQIGWQLGEHLGYQLWIRLDDQMKLERQPSYVLGNQVAYPIMSRHVIRDQHFSCYSTPVVDYLRRQLQRILRET